MPRGVYFCEVKGVTHANDDGTSRRAAQGRCAPGEAVRLIPEPSNAHDRHAIRVVLQTGEQIGYISARQAARFEGRAHRLIATVHSKVKDQWGNDTIKLRVVDSAPAEARDSQEDVTGVAIAQGKSSSQGVLAIVAGTAIILAFVAWLVIVLIR